MRIQLLVVLQCLLNGVAGAAQPFVMGDLMGQLGNQMFQIAAATSLALDHDAVAIFPGLDSQEEYNIPLNREWIFSHLSTEMPQEPINFCYIEPSFQYNPIPYTPNMRIRGWFQSEKYFGHHKEEICALFAPSEEIVSYLNEKYSFILEHPNTVAIHHREYSSIENPLGHVYMNCDVSYYQAAIDLFPEKALFVVFSNNISWCKEQFKKINRNFYFIENEIYYYDFYLMSACKHNIISNSSFSWWAAYLNPNPAKKIIAPEAWFHPNYRTDSGDLIPSNWWRIGMNNLTAKPCINRPRV